MTHLVIIPTDGDPILRLANNQGDALRLAEKSASAVAASRRSQATATVYALVAVATLEAQPPPKRERKHGPVVTERVKP